MRRLAMIAAGGTLAFAALLVQRPSLAGQSPKVEPAQTRGSVRFIQLPEMEAELPPGVARDAVLVNCGSCHSTRYITIQPRLTREAWVAVVTKMRKTYGAPVPEEQVNAIVDYVFAVRGAPAAPKP
jgi:hypothetical protein